MKVDVRIEMLRTRMLKGLRFRGIDDESAEFIVNDFIEAELEGHSSHGLSKYLLVDAALEKKEEDFELINERGNYAIVDGHKDIGHVAGLYCVDKAIGLAKQYGNSVVAMRNASRYSRLKPFARRIADSGCIGIVMNNGGPAAVAPYGGNSPIFGTNPICFSFPSKDGAYVFDFSTSKKVWGEIRQSFIENRPLPQESFYDKDGNFTVVPSEANAVVSFGETKGYALCYAIEILTGAFVGCKMGLQVSDEYDLGFIFIALSPEMFTSIESFMSQVDMLAQEVRDSRPVVHGKRVFVPGDLSQSKMRENINRGSILVEKEIVDRIILMENSNKGGIESNKTLN